MVAPYNAPRPDADALRPTFVGAIAQLHHGHELRAVRAARVRNADVAGLDRDAARLVSELAPRFSGRAVAPGEAALLVTSDDATAPVPFPAPVVDTAEFEQMVTAYEETYRPAAAARQTQRALQRAASDVLAARRASAMAPRAVAADRARASSGMRARGGETRVASSLTQAERDLEQRMREQAA